MVKRIVLVGFFGILIGASCVFFYLYSVYARIVVKPNIVPISINPDIPTPTPDPLAPKNVLLLGYGGGTHDGGYLTDTMIVAHIDPREEAVTLISLPRDTWVSLPVLKDGEVSHKINAAYAYGRDENAYPERPQEFTGAAGGGQLAKYAAEQIVGMPVDHFVAVSFEGFTKSIDVLGGVDVDVPHTFDDYFYPIEEEKDNLCDKTEEDLAALTATLSGELLEKEFPCRYEHLHFDKGIEHMDGVRALQFVRSRKSETYGGDYNRSLRQLALLTAIKKKIISIGFIPKIFPFISSLTYDMQTDIDASVVQEKLSTYPDPADFVIKTISLSNENVLAEDRSDDGQYVLVPVDGKGEWAAVHEYVASQLKQPTPSTSADIEQESYDSAP